MDDSSVMRLLNALHENIINLPAYLTAKGITSDDDIAKVIDGFKQQVEQIATVTESQNEYQRTQLKSMQAEVDFVKKVYLDNRSAIDNSNKYQVLYADALKKLEQVKAQPVTEAEVVKYENEIQQMSSTLAQDQDCYKKVEKNFNSLLRLVYPDDDDTNIESINEKLIKYIENSNRSNQLVNSLNQTIDQLNKTIDDTNVQAIITRCNEKLNYVKSIMITYNNKDISFPHDLMVDLIAELSFEMDSTGTWVPENYVDTMPVEEAIVEESEIMIEEEIVEIPKTPTISCSLDQNQNSDTPVTVEDIDDVEIFSIAEGEVPKTPGRDIPSDDVGTVSSIKRSKQDDAPQKKRRRRKNIQSVDFNE
ncbi:OrNV gp026-like protein [Tomelloso virus]|uniref:OrNV gp026-like protein n=1 Tax=Tomelloso virus TaxID=2053981 RepID=A0A2H4T2Q9_9VIRU|nr:OrNV gp026-like protein [Tomelloso virus]ATY70207.1 OrNV gp026-like protein [Tomelloso virus]